MPMTKDAQREKTTAALSSVLAAVGLTGLKILVAILTGSLGIMAEAAHSGLDLIAALMTFFAVRVADRPADADHNYGHGKVENLSALLEALLLLLTAAWVIFEASQRLLFHTGHVEINIWAFIVMLVSIVVDITRSRLLLRVAKKLGSQALEADALHFSTDIWSSAVVILGLLIVYLTQIFHLPIWLEQADAIAAFGVSGIVIWVSLKLARETSDALLDKSPGPLAMQIQQKLMSLEQVISVRRVRVRRAGNKCFADVIIQASRLLSFDQIHQLSESVEQATITEVHAFSALDDIDVVVHVEPVISSQESITDQIYYLAEHHGVHAHHIHVREVAEQLEADFDLEVQADMSLEQAHAVATRLEQAVLQTNQRLRRVTTHLEPPDEKIVQRQDVTDQYQEMASHMCRIADGIAGTGSAHDIHLYRPSKALAEIRGHRTKGAPELDLVLHTIFDAQAPLSQVHIDAEKIKRALRRSYPNLNTVIIHTEPPEASISRS
ncbi:cation diffusion facilitator family transporter [Dictyobacter arantiisoli]|uniref:Cation transporter n=1 Tax=Dictyobacter arantiisoli TaxID=2014874 RepID=A0A5A5TEC6_9CHLR|nr:cation diffusion facilitator family transporter [Dictyobacter arantiisoli]GCF09496.1 cation transporter [Dictyobacter arantiisoli]